MRAQVAERGLGGELLEVARMRPDAVHLQWLDAEGQVARRSYAESARRALAIAGGLLARGVEPRDRIALIGEPGPLQVEATLGIWLAGATLVPLDPQWSVEALGRGLRKAKVRCGIAIDACLALLSGAVVSATLAPSFLLLDAASLVAAGAATERSALPAVSPDWPALVLFTSGTTGEPKGVVQRHRSLAWNAAAVLGGVDAGPNDNLLSILPLHHIFGLLVSVILPPIVGARVTFAASLKGPDVSRAMQRTSPTIVPAVPQLLLGLDRTIEARLDARSRGARWLVSALRTLTLGLRRLGINPGRRLFGPVHEALGGKLRLFASAGAALDPAVARRLYSLGFDVIEGYGLTETGPAVSFDRIERPSFGSVGVPLPGVEVRVADPDEAGVGEIVVRSPSLFDGYLDDPEATRAMLVDGWVHTGDLGRLDAERRLWLTGRKKEVIVLGSGKNVYPHEIEARFDLSAFVAESCVVGLAEAGRRGTDKLHAVLVPDLEAFRRAGEGRIEVTLRHELNRIGDALPSHHRVVGFTVRSQPLPRTPLGKLKRFQVLEELLAERRGERVPPRAAAGGPRAEEPRSPYWPAVVGALRSVTGPEASIRPESGIELDLGLDSLARVEALAALEERLRTRLPEGFGAEALSVGELLAEVESYMESEDRLAGFEAMASGRDARARSAELHSWARRVARPLGVVLVMLLWLPVWLLARGLWSYRVSGRAHLPRGAYLVCPNHGSYLDAIVIMLGLPALVRPRVWALGDYEIFSHPVMRVVALLGNVIRVDAGAGLKATLEAGGAVLCSGFTLVLFPEGARAPEGERLEFRRGAAILARTFGVPIVPVWLEGVDRLLPRGSSWPRLGGRIAVRFGPPLDPRSTDAEPDPARALTERLREAVLRLGDEERAAGG